MSRENVEIIEGWARAWNRGDREGWLALTHPDVEWSSAIQRQVEGTDHVYKGQAEVGRFWDEWRCAPLHCETPRCSRGSSKTNYQLTRP
jgi:SnoaL-like domain